MKLQRLVEIYVNEKSTKSFLNYKKEVVDFFYEKLLKQIENVKNMSSNELNIVKCTYELEIERIEYLLKEYLTLRINKLKLHSTIDNELLSASEKDYYDILKEQMIYKNKRDESFDIVGFICKKDIGSVLLDEETVEMYKDDFYVGPFSDVRDLLDKDEIYLV